MWLYLSGLDPSPIVKLTPIVKESCSVIYPTDHSLMHQYGMISRRCRMMGEIGQESTSFTAVFLVRTLALQEMEKAWQESKADYFSRSCGWPNKSSQNSYSLRMYQISPTKVVTGYLPQYPRWGMIVDG